MKKNKVFKYVVKRKFRIVPFTATEHNPGRCVNCDANNICGSKFTCHADFDEQYKEV